MTAYIALLRAVNVGGTGKLPMEDLRALCAQAGFAKVRTLIASGNVIFSSRKSEARVKAALEARFQDYAGEKVGVFVRTAAEMAAVAANNPFSPTGPWPSFSTHRRLVTRSTMRSAEKTSGSHLGSARFMSIMPREWASPSSGFLPPRLELRGT